MSDDPDTAGLSASLVALARQAAGLTQEELAERTGLSVRGISNLERGVVGRPRRASLDALAQALGLSGTDRGRFIEYYRHGVLFTQQQQQQPPPPQPTLAAAPAQLPAAIQTFTGRDEQLRHLDRLIADRGDTVTSVLIHGTAGAGKTALALNWAHKVRAQFPDGQLYANLSGHGPVPPVDPSTVLAQFLRAMGVCVNDIPVNQEARAALFRSLLAGRRVLFVLDGARNPAQVRPLLPGLPGSKVVVTSRSRMGGLRACDGAHRISVEPLSTVEGVALLARLIGPQRVASDPGCVVQIVDCCAGLPLALAIVADRVAESPGRPLVEFAAELVDVHTRLDRLEAADDDAAKIRNVISWSYDALPAKHARAFRLLSAHPGSSFGLASAAEMLATDVRELRQLLDLLVGVHLLERRAHSRFEFHDLMRIYAAELSDCLDGQADRAAALQRVRAFYLDIATTASDAHERAIGGEGLAQQCTCAGDAAASGAGEGANPASLDEGAVGPARSDDADVNVDWRDQARALRDLVPSREIGSASGEGTGLDDLGLRHRWGRYDLAAQCFEQAHRIGHQSGDLGLLSASHNNLGLVMLHSGKVAEAADEFTAACAVAKRSGDREGEGYALANLGNAHRFLGHRLAAREHLLRARVIARESALTTLELIVGNYLGELECAAEPEASAAE